MGFRFVRQEPIPDVILVEFDRHGDSRGWFIETHRRTVFAAAGIDADFVQDNHSLSAKGTLRGLHYQKPPAAQGKLVRCISGRFFDVAVDIRRGSPTYGRHAHAVLSGEDLRAIWIPPGFAHGFVALTDEVQMIYKTTAEYRPDLERTVRWDDSSLAIPWPVENPPLISARDRDAPLLADADNDFVWAPT